MLPIIDFPESASSTELFDALLAARDWASVPAERRTGVVLCSRSDALVDVEIPALGVIVSGLRYTLLQARGVALVF